MADGVQLGSAYGRIELDGSQALETVNSLADSMRKAGTAMSLGVTAPLMGIAAAAVNSAGDFEQSLNIMAQVSGATADQMAQMQAQALQLGAVTSFSAGEAAQAMLELGKAGLSPAEIMEAIGGTMDLAAAGNLGLAQAAEIAANAVNTFGLEASDTTEIANMLAAAANASSVDVTDLAAGMTMAGSVFSSAGQSIEDLNVAMALLGNNGIKGSDAGTSLKTALMRLTAPTDGAAEALANLGVSVFDAQGNMREFPAILADLQQGLMGTNAVTVTNSNLTVEQADRMEYLKSTIDKTQRKLADYNAGIAGVAQSENDKIVAQDRLNRVLAAAQAEYAGLAAIGGTTSTVMKTLTEEERQHALATIFGADAIRSISVLMAEGTDGWNEMADALGVAGAATSVANARMKGMNGAIEYLKGSIDSFLIGAALPYLGMMGDFVRMTADGLTAISSLPRPLLDAAVAFGAVLAAAGPVMLAITGITAAVGFLLSPVGLLVAGIAAVAAGFVLWQQNFGNIQGRVAALAGTLKNMAKSATGIDFDAIGDSVRSFGSYIGAVVEDGDYLNDWLTHLPEALQPAAEAFGRFLAAVGDLVQTGNVQAFVEELRNMFPEAAAQVDAAIAAMRANWAAAWETMRAGFDSAWQAIQPALASAWAWLQVALPAALVWLQSAWNAAWPAMQAAWDTVWQALQAAWTAAQVWMETTLPAALTALKTAWDAAWPGMQAAVIATWQAIQPALAGAWAWLQVALPAALAWLQSAWETAWPAMQAAWDAIWPAIQTAWTAVKTWLDVTLPTALAALKTAWDTVWPALKTAWDAVWPPIEAAWTAVKTWLDVTLPAALTAFKTAWDTVWPALQTGTSTAIDGVTGAFDSLKSAFTSIQAGAGQVQGAFGGLSSQIMTIGSLLAAFFAPSVERLQTAFAALPEKLAPLMPKLQELGGAFMGLLQSLAPFVALIGAGLAIAADFGINRLATLFESLPQILGPIIDQVTATIKLITVILTEVVAGVQAAINGDWTAVWESAKTIAGEFNTFFRGLFSRLGVFMGAIARNISEPIINTLKDLGVDITPLLDGVRKTFEDIWSKIQGYIQPVIDLVGTLTTVITDFGEFLGGLNLPNPFAGLASAADAVRNAIGEFGAGVVEGFTGQPSTQTTEDGTAGGTSYFPGGQTQINERGYEQIVLPAGSRVYTNGQTNNLPGQKPTVININLGGVQVSGDMDARRLANMMRDQLAALGV